MLNWYDWNENKLSLNDEKLVYARDYYVYVYFFLVHVSLPPLYDKILDLKHDYFSE